MSRAEIWERLDLVTDQRSPRGLVYPLRCLAAVWLCSLTAAGHDRVSAVRGWLRRTSDEERARLRLPWDPFDGYRLPSAATIHRFLAAVDDGELAVALLDPPLDPNPPAEEEACGQQEPAAAQADAATRERVAPVSAVAVAARPAGTRNAPTAAGCTSSARSATATGGCSVRSMPRPTRPRCSAGCYGPLT
ncbi:transposase family protein [Parafrankia sp. EAN1pec]|uniref:transposase family protein n=1 Tax=Parafrankia sp. (strain EAN1pec) TaxID=298653 RepID=UPI00321A192D